MKHFLIFLRTNNHCVNYLVRAPSLREAMAKYFVQERLGAELLDDGSIQTDDSYNWNEKIIYAHPLECIESQYKSMDGLYGQSWEIGELREEHWSADFAEAFWSADPSSRQNSLGHGRGRSSGI